MVSNLDIYQSRVTPDKERIVFVDSSRQNLWVMDWGMLPRKLKTSQNLSLDRNWDIDNNNLYGIDRHGIVFTINLTSGQYQEFTNLNGFSNIQRPQRLIYGLAATKSIRTESDFWISDISLP